MKILGPERVTYGVDDLAVAKKFWSDFGLALTEESPDRLLFETVERTSIEVRPIDAPDLPPAVVPGNTARVIAWGVESEADLEEIAAALGRVTDVRFEDDVVRASDPNGYAIAFIVSHRVPIEPAEIDYNRPAAPARVDRRAEIYRKATPQTMAHVVVQAPKLDEAEAFYREVLDFRLTDSYPGFGIFLRANANHEHHNLFLLKSGDQPGFHHVAFEVRNIHEVFGGGLNMTENGWETHLGPGRHPISSAYFWYFRNPCGGAAEYDSDTDYVTDDWQPGEWKPGPDSFAEWAFPSGTERYKGGQRMVRE
jgi:catechol 2,3-dioxygenase-like lactoylglutathione lyase family enzyme